MACTDKVFIASHTVFPLTISSGFTVADIADLEVILSFGAESVSKKLSTGGVVIDVSDNITFIIEIADVTVPGIYSMKVLLTDTNADISQISPCPSVIKFHER